MTRIPLTRGYYAIVDDKFAERVLVAGRWQYHHGYADREFTVEPGRYITIGMHRYICQLAGYAIDDNDVDHRNRDKLDNRLGNLRIASKAANQHNVGLRRDNASGFKGVSFERESGRWRACIMVAGKLISLGRFHSPEEAAKAYNKAAKKHFGRFAWLNPV